MASYSFKPSSIMISYEYAEHYKDVSVFVQPIVNIFTKRSELKPSAASGYNCIVKGITYCWIY